MRGADNGREHLASVIIRSMHIQKCYSDGNGERRSISFYKDNYQYMYQILIHAGLISV